MKTRPFKFRAFVKAEKTMIYNINNIKINNNGEIESFTFGEGKRVFQIDRYPENINAFEKTHVDFEIMQFTGLHDKDGKEIYEGDIVEVDETGEIFLIIFEYFGFSDKAIKSDWSDGFFFEYYSKENFHLIGNMYEHPQLLDKNNG